MQDRMPIVKSGTRGDNIIAVGIIGSGQMAREYCKVLQAHPLYDVVGLASRNATTSKTLCDEFKIKYHSRSINELCGLANIRLIVVAVSETSTAAVVEELIDKPQVVLVEKPFGLSLAESRRLLSKSRRRSSPIFVALNRRFYDSTKKLADELNEVEGSRMFLLQDQHDTLAARANGSDERTMNNWMFANAIHTVDLVNFLGRGNARVVKTTKTSSGPSSFVIEASISFTSGDKATYFSVWNSPGPWVLNVYTESVRMVMGPLEQLSRQPRGSRLLEEIVGPDSSTPLKPGLWNLVEELCKHWDGGEPSIPSPQDSYESMKLVASIFKTRG